ncbi:MAG: S8 family serine peptidase [bacterium]
MKTKPVLFACAGLTLLGLGVWLALHAHKSRAAAATARREVNTRLLASVQTLPKPTLTNLPSVGNITSTVATAAAARKNPPPPALLTEKTLAPLRSAFSPPRFAERTDLPPGRQTLLSNRLLVSPEARSFPQTPSGNQSPTPRQTTPFLVLFNTPVNDASRQSLKSLGATVRGYFPNNALLAELTPAVLGKLQTVASIQAAEEFLPSDKLQPFLAWLIASQAPASLIRTTLQTLAPEDVESVASAVRGVGGDVENVSAGARWGIVHATLPLSAIRTLTTRGEVQWIEERVNITTRNNKAAIGTHLNTTNVWQTWGLTGKGQIIGHADTGLDTGQLATLHPDFQGHVLAIIARGRPGDASDTDGHGTHTAGSLCGNGAASTNLYRGMAYEAQLVHQSVVDEYGYFSGITDIYTLFAESYGYGARIHSDSWGSDTAGYYDSDCISVDEFAWDNPDHLAVYASGNAGRDSNSDGIVDLGAVGSPASAKNVLAIGATENDRPAGSGGYSSLKYTVFTDGPPYYRKSFPLVPILTDYISYSATTSPYRQGMAAFSSRGPTQDGRVKPDLVAPGTDVISCKSSVGGSGWGNLSSNSRYCFNGGTSMSTPLTAGTAALVRQYAVERGGVTNPSAALVKAMLIGGARSLTPGQYGTNATREIPAFSPNHVEGWGQPDIEATVHPAGRMVRLFDRLSPSAGTTNTFAVTVTVSNTPLDIALAWIDFPATAGAGVTRVNDLDLQVAAPDGSLLYPNGGAARDTLNTVETLRVANAPVGIYQVRVIGEAVPYTGGAAALYVRGAIDAPPLIVHTPLPAQVVRVTPFTVAFYIQNLTALTHGEARLFWTTGTASAATGTWQAATALWVSNALYQADIPAQPPATYVHYYLQADTGTYSIRLPQTAPAATFSFYIDVLVELTVAGAPARFGIVTPPYGTNSVIAGVSLDAGAPAAVAISNGMRRTCSGWTGTGDVAPSGATNAFTFTLRQPSSLTWQWQAEFALTNRYRQMDTGALLSEQIVWHAANSYASTVTAPELVFVGTNSTPYVLCGWDVDGVRWPDISSTSLNPASGILMSKPRLAQGSYLPFWQDTNLNLLGDGWELRYWGTTDNGAVASADLDGDGWSNLSEYLDNTDPRNPASHPTPPVITWTPLSPFQTARCPWRIQAQITDNLTVDHAFLIWREHNDSAWQTNAMTWVSNTTYEAVLAPPSHGVKRVDYLLRAYDMVGYYDPAFCTTTPIYSVIGDYDTPWLSVSPQSFPTFKLSTPATNASLTIANLAGPDLVWTVRVATVTAPFAATNSAWSHNGVYDLWHVDTNRTWNGAAVWYCGDQVKRLYSNDCHSWLDTPAFRVGANGGLLFRQWIKTETDTATHFWDGAVLNVSTNGGATFTRVEPVGGYPYQITDNPASPFPANQPCFAGQGEGWQTVLLDLAAFSGQDVIVRFEFGSDSYTVDEGWYIANVTPFSYDTPGPTWLIPQGACSGILPDTWSASATFRIDPATLAYGEEVVACLRVTSNDPTSAPLMPLIVQRGRILSVEARGPGTATTDLSFFYRDATHATVNLQADTGAYLYSITSNGVPQPGIYDFTTVSKTLVFTNLAEDLSIIAWFAYRTWNLSISTPYSMATPSAGTYTLPYGTLITASVVAPLQLAADIRLDCGGWSLTGHTPATGSTAQVSFTLTNSATLVWNWHFSYKLTALAGSNGTVSPTNTWYQEGSTAVITAYPADYYHLLDWLGDIAGAGFDDTRLILPMIEPRTVTATFAPNLTPTHSVPEYWLAAYGWTQAFETAAETDADRDGMMTWQEWRADTQPTNPLSLLTLTALQAVSNGWRLTWIGGLLRTQHVERANTPAGPWTPVYTNLPPTAITNSLLLPTVGAPRFYRILVP